MINQQKHILEGAFFVLLEGPPFFVGKKLRLQIQSGASLCQARLSQCLLKKAIGYIPCIFCLIKSFLFKSFSCADIIATILKPRKGALSDSIILFYLTSILTGI